MFLTSYFLAFYALYVASEPLPDFQPSNRDAHSLPLCPHGMLRDHLDNELFPQAKEACERLFQTKPSAPTQATWCFGPPPPLPAGSPPAPLKRPSELHHNPTPYQATTWRLGGNVNSMTRETCEFAFTSEDAYQYNVQKGNVCFNDMDGTVNPNGYRPGDWIGFTKWEFEQDGRTYSADFTKWEAAPQRGCPANGAVWI